RVEDAVPALTEAGSGRLGTGRLLETQLLDRRLAHLELLDLAGDGHRELVDEQHVARHLEMRQPPAAVVADVVLARRLAVLQPDPRAQLLAVLHIRHADDLYVGDRGVAVEELLDLARV